MASATGDGIASVRRENTEGADFIPQPGRTASASVSSVMWEWQNVNCGCCCGSLLQHSAICIWSEYEGNSRFCCKSEAQEHICTDICNKFQCLITMNKSVNDCYKEGSKSVKCRNNKKIYIRIFTSQKVFKYSKCTKTFEKNQQEPTESSELKKLKKVICLFQAWMISILIVFKTMWGFVITVDKSSFLFLLSILPPHFFNQCLNSQTDNCPFVYSLNTCLLFNKHISCQGSTFRISWNSSWHSSENTFNDQWDHWVWINCLCVWKPGGVWTVKTCFNCGFTEGNRVQCIDN